MRWIPWAIVLMLFAPATPRAQLPSEGSIRGFVTDEQGAVLPGVNLTARSTTGTASVTAVSDNKGYYRLLNLAPGEYTVTAELQGFAKFVREGVIVRAGLNLALNVTVKVGSVSETVEVKAETPLLEASTAVQAVNVAGEFQRSMPLSARRYWHDFLGVMPGTINTELGAQPYNVHGASFSALVMQLDGVDIAPPLQSTNVYVNMSNEILEDVQVKIAGIDASAPLGNGAVINMVTKSGTNQLKGAASVSYQARAWNGNNNPGGTVTDFEAFQPDLSLGGPIVRDRWWFFGAYRYRYENSGISRSPEQVAVLKALVPGFEPSDNSLRAHYPFVKTDAWRRQRLARSRLPGGSGAITRRGTSSSQPTTRISRRYGSDRPWIAFQHPIRALVLQRSCCRTAESCRIRWPRRCGS